MPSPCEKAQTFESLPDVLNCQLAAEYLGLHVKTLRNYVKEDKIRAVRVGKYYRIRKEWLIDFLEHSSLT